MGSSLQGQTSGMYTVNMHLRDDSATCSHDFGLENLVLHSGLGVDGALPDAESM